MDFDTLTIAGIEPESIVDGPGIRYTIFVQGCPHKCKGCHNPQTHSFEGGTRITCAEIMKNFKENPMLSGITFSGGEPFCQPEALCVLAREVRILGKNVICYSGYTIEELISLGNVKPAILELLSLTDYLIDGKYIEDLRDLTLPFRGSSNQRFINIKDHPEIFESAEYNDDKP